MERKSLIALVIIGVLAGSFFAWTAFGLIFGEKILKEDKSNETVSIFISGSTTCFPIIVKCAEVYEDDHEDFNIGVTGGGSSKGISDVINGLVDLGMASRPLKSTESSISGMTQIAFANDGIALVMKSGNTHFSGGFVPQWTITDVLKIFNGTYRYWKDVPGCTGNEQIVLVGRDSNSGTRASFEELTGLIDDDGYLEIVGGTHPWQTIQELNSNGAVHDAVATDDNAIGYVGLGYIDAEVEGIDLGTDGIHFYEPNAANVKSGDYPISRQLYLVYRYEIPEDAKDFVDFIFGSKGQALVESEGFVKL
jgi:phosphate transport system substrate-binding protein